MIKPFLEVGQIVSTHGIHGEVRIQPWCDEPSFLTQFHTLYFDKKGEKPINVLSSRVHGNIVIMKLDNIDTVEQASLLRQRVLFMNRKDAKIEEGSHFVQDLLDCKVIDADSPQKVYGILSDVSVTGANDVWHIKNEQGKEYLIPAIASVVIQTDVQQGIIKIRPLKGIFDDEN